MRLRSLFRLGICCLLLSYACSVATAGPILSVFPSISPNPWWSPSWEDYARNAVYALENGLSAYGTPGTPAYYQQITTFLPGQVVLTGFPSWQGQAPPPPGFENEYGNMLFFGLHVISDTPFTLADLNYDEFFFGYIDSFNFTGQFFWYDLVGLYINGGVTRYDELNPGNDSVPIHQLFFVGLGNGFYVDDPADLPGALAAIMALGPPDAYGTGTYSIGQAFGSGTATLIPEPCTVSLLALGLAGVGSARWRARER